MMHDTTGAGAASAAPASSPSENTEPARKRRWFRPHPLLPRTKNTSGGKPALSKPLLLALLAATAGAAVWGVPRHPLYQEWRYARMPLPELGKARAGRLDD